VVHEEHGADGRPLVVVYQVDVAHPRYSAQAPAPAVAVPQPSSVALYVGYGSALVVGLLAVGWAAAAGRLVSRRRGTP
jgi:hypothetical protein